MDNIHDNKINNAL